MKDYIIVLFGLVTLTGCGQPGPLYLPTERPPIYVEPEPKPEATSDEILKSPPATQSEQTLPEKTQ